MMLVVLLGLLAHRLASLYRAPVMDSCCPVLLVMAAIIKCRVACACILACVVLFTLLYPYVASEFDPDFSGGTFSRKFDYRTERLHMGVTCIGWDRDEWLGFSENNTTALGFVVDQRILSLDNTFMSLPSNSMCGIVRRQSRQQRNLKHLVPKRMHKVTPPWRLFDIPPSIDHGNYKLTLAMTSGYAKHLVIGKTKL